MCIRDSSERPDRSGRVRGRVRGRRAYRSGSHSPLGASRAAGQALGDPGSLAVQLGLLLGPGLGAPDLHVLAGADHHAGSGQAGVLDQQFGDADAPGRVERVVEGGTMEAAAQAAGVLAEGAVRLEEALGELLESRGGLDPDAGIETLGENDAVSKIGTEPRRNGEAIL